jgi:hypothetical protein
VKFLATFLVCLPLFGQAFQIVPSTAPHGGGSSLLITFISPGGKQPVALQWKIMLGAEVTAAREDFVAGDAAVAAHKALACALGKDSRPENLTYNCIIAAGRETISTGTIAVVKYKVKPEAAAQTVVVRITDGIAVLEQSNQLQKANLAPAEGTITIR